VPTLLILRPQDVIPADFHGGERLGAALSSPEPFRFVQDYLRGLGTLDRQAVWGSVDAFEATWIVLRFEEPANRCHLYRSATAPTWWVEFEETTPRDIGRAWAPATRRRAIAGQADYLIRAANAGFSIFAREAPSPVQQEWQRQVMIRYAPPEPDISHEILGAAAPIPAGRMFSQEEIAALARQIPPDPTMARALRSMRGAVPQMGSNQWGRPGGMPSNRDIANRTRPGDFSGIDMRNDKGEIVKRKKPEKLRPEHTLGRCENCEHFYEDHGGDDQCPGEYGGDPRAHPTWAPPEVARLLDTEPSKPADSQDIHAERYRMIELD
jgi:hypothetical protein